jgi:deoxyadenosine kinase
MDNEYLTDFYSDMAKYSFPMQIYLLNKRFAQQQQIIWSACGGVQDRSIYEDSVFAKCLKDSGLMSERDYETYVSLFQHMSNFMKKPNFLIHLDLTPEESLRRIRMRARGCEVGVTLEYLTQLHAAYEEFIQDISRVIPVFKVNYSQFRTVQEMAARIKQEYARISHIQYIDWPTSLSNSPKPQPLAQSDMVTPQKRAPNVTASTDQKQNGEGRTSSGQTVETPQTDLSSGSEEMEASILQYSPSSKLVDVPVLSESQ